MKIYPAFLMIILLLVACENRDDQQESEVAGQQVGEAASEASELATDGVILAVEEWNVPFDETRTRDPFVAPGGTVFFAGQREHYIGYFDPQTETFGYHELEDGDGPHTVVVAGDGTVWYAGNRARHIGRIDHPEGEITRFMMDSDYARDPHTFTIDRHGNIWFTAQGGNGVGYFDVQTGEAEVIPVPTERARPYGIVMDPGGERPWIALLGTNKLATVDPQTMELEEIELPREETRVRRLDTVSDGTVWYGDFAAGYLGRYNPGDGSVREWEMPEGENSRPYAVLSDDRDRIWLSASGLDPNRLIVFDTRTEEFVDSRVIDTAEGSIRHMNFDERTRSMWFGTDTGHIGRAITD